MQAEHGYDLPMTIMNNGEIEVFEPSFEEVAELLNSKYYEIERIVKKNPEMTKEEAIKSFATNIGFNLNIDNYAKGISAKNLSLKNKKEISVGELISYLSEATGMPKGSKFTYGIKGRLKEVINTRREDDGLSKINNFKNHIVQEQDIKNLVSLLDNELGSGNAKHKFLKKVEVKQVSQEIISDISKRRDGKLAELVTIKSKLKGHVVGSKGSAIREFLIK